MKPALFEGTTATDEHSLCTALGAKAESVMRRHRETFITRDDFKWLRDRGLNAVRIPIGYWLFNPEPPFVGGAEVLDQALNWCDEFQLAANIDLHGLPGSQGPEHHTGREKFFRWGKEDSYLKRSLEFIEQVAQRYKDRSCVRLFSIVNEPDVDLPAAFLKSFNEAAYDLIRKYMPPERVAVVIAAFTEARLPEFHRHLTRGKNVLTDIHPYACFGKWSADQLMDYVHWGRDSKVPALKKAGPEDLICGEWSLGVAGTLKPAIQALPPDQQDAMMRTFADGQLLAYNQTAGWFFWSYKVESLDPFARDCWCFRNAVERGWLPASFS